MPELYFQVEWPDQSVTRCYSPSSVLREYFEVGEEYTVEEFAARSTSALEHASRRVVERFGYACSSAQDQLRLILEDTRRFSATDTVRILDIV